VLTAAVILSAKVMFTGVLALVPSKKDHHLIRVVAPNGRVPDLAEAGIPAHVAYVMFMLDDLASKNPKESRQPDFVIARKDGVVVGVCLIKGEYLQAGPFSSTATAPDIDEGLPAEIFECCRDPQDTHDVPLDPSVLKKSPDPTRVGMRIDLAHGDLGNERASIDPTASYIVKGDRSCRSLTRLISATLKEAAPQLTIRSTPFQGSAEQTPLLLKSKTGGELRVLIGNEPLGDLEPTSDFLVDPNSEQPAHSMDIRPPHMRLLRRLTQGMQLVLTPEIIAFARCVSGVALPPTDNGGGGKPDVCNPTGIRPADPYDVRAAHKPSKKD
jgi:hypothetical protein